MPKGRMIWSNAKKKGTAPCDTADIVHKKPKFNPDRNFINSAIDDYLASGGQITRITEIEWSTMIYGHMSSCYIEDN